MLLNSLNRQKEHTPAPHMLKGYNHTHTHTLGEADAYSDSAASAVWCAQEIKTDRHQYNGQTVISDDVLELSSFPKCHAADRASQLLLPISPSILPDPRCWL